MSPAELDRDWHLLLTMLPSDLERCARESGSLVRRREVRSGADLLHLAFVYAVSNLSLRSTACWASEVGLADFSDVALLKRLKAAAPFVARLLTEKLAERTELPALSALPESEVTRADTSREPGKPPPGRVRLLDATVLCRPGALGTDFRLHLGFDLRSLCIDHVELTDAKGGETLTRLPMEPGDLVVADRGYSHRPGIAAAARAGADLIVRLNWYNVPLLDAAGEPFVILAALRTLSPGEVGEFAVQTAPDPKAGLPAVRGRFLAIAKSAAAAEEARRKLRRQAKKKGKTPSKETLEAAGYVFLFTTLPAEQLDSCQALELYRFRWQIELAFKRMKGILALDELAARDEALARTTLLTRLLSALLVEELSGAALKAVPFSPWGYGSPRSHSLPMAGVSRRHRHPAPSGRGRRSPGAMAYPQRSRGSTLVRRSAPPTESSQPGAASL